MWKRRHRDEDFATEIDAHLALETERLIAEAASRDFKYHDQIRDAVASACRNTSEGLDRFRPAEFIRFLDYAKGSLLAPLEPYLPASLEPILIIIM
jgi:hypothetical protein